MHPLTLTIRSVVLGLALNIASPAIVSAETVTSVVDVQLYEIPAGALKKALEQFARTARSNLNYVPDQLKGKRSSGLSGHYDSHEALDRLLLGSGIQAVANADGFDLRLEQVAPHQLNPINVYGRLRNDSLFNVPQSVSVRGREYFEAGTADSVGDVIESVPGASRIGSSMDMFSDDYLIRGFNAEQSTNGLGFRRNDHPTDLANVERIEVLKGPSSVLFGQMEPGGTVNVVTKQPLDYFQADTSVEYGNHNRVRTALDVTGPLNDTVRARLNMAYQDGDGSVDNLSYQRLFIAPNLEMDLTESTSLTIEGSYSANTWHGIHGGAPLEGSIQANPNGRYAKSFNPGGDDSTTERDSKMINIRLTEAVTDRVDARFSYTYTRNDADWNEYVPFGLDETDHRTLDRLVFVGKDTYKKDHELVVDLSGELEVGGLSHTFILGFNYQDSSLFRPTRLHMADSIDLYNPQYKAAILSEAPLIRDRGFVQDTEVMAAFFQDRITFKDSFHLIGGLRYTDSEQSQVSVDHLNNSESQDALNQSDWTTQIGVIYDLSDDASVYVNRSESFVPQGGTTSGKKPLEAEESTQYEVGMRFDLEDMEINLAGFVIRKENIAIEDPLDGNFEVAQGTAQSRGFELSIGGHLTPDWYLNAAYGYTDTEILYSDDKALEGNRFANVPLHTASLQTGYQINAIPGLSIGGAIIYVGSRPGNDDNSFELPGHTRVDLAAYYALNDQLQLDLLVDNVLDEEVFSPGAFNGVVREPSRTFAARLKYQF
ncbi:TonB-dependent receptor [Motiliproteus sp. MSK22-1]|nr:TonB-dependent receptor [Motiliproteus sp. MSK22-1]